MSAIYGYTAYRENEQKRIDSLRSQNLRYGGDKEEHLIIKEDADQEQTKSTSVLGCCVKFLSNRHTDGSVIISSEKYKAVFDALLFNRSELELSFGENSNLNYNGKSVHELNDGEFLFFYVQKFGFSELKNVDGDFAGAIYDTESEIWTLVRDHSGIRPLFYYLDQDKFVFSTDIRGIVAFPGIQLSLNETYFYNTMMGYNELTLCETDYREIHCIRPAAWTVVDEEFKKTENIYWEPGKDRIRYKEPERYAKELRNLVTDSVRRRLDAVSGMVGCELSGGLDSSVIAILIHRFGRDCSYFSWSYAPKDHPLQKGEDERKVILDICAQEGISCSFVKKKDSDDTETLQEQMDRGSVPYMNTGFLSEGSKKVRCDGAGVMFTGHGGDEGVSHRANLYELWVCKERIAFFKAIWNSTAGKNRRLLRFGSRVFRQFREIHPNLRREFRSRSNMEYFLTDSFKEKMKDTEHLPLTFAYDPALYILQGGHRVRIDNAAVQGAENGIQYIFPYLDFRVLDYVLSIPRYCFQNGYTNRAVFREAFADLMPASLKAVHYKDEASQRNSIHSEEEIAQAASQATEEKIELVRYLNKDLWSRYLDFSKLEQISLKTENNEADVYRSLLFIEELLYCARIQKLQEMLGGSELK